MLPIGTNISPRRTPYANYILIAVNAMIFLVTMHIAYDPGAGEKVLAVRPQADLFLLNPQRPMIWQFVTYAFLHGSIMHIVGNMYFLYLFGNNVNDRLGHAGYLCLYLAGAVFSGLGHSVLHITPVLGASGAVAAVTGAYLVLFPNTVITVLYLFVFIGTFEMRALYFILLKLIFWDNIFEPNWVRQSVAYDAHLAGYAFGIFSVFLLLTVRLLDSSQDDLFAIVRQWNRRRKFRDAVFDGYDPFKPDKRVRKSSGGFFSREKETQTVSNENIQALRGQIVEHLRRHDLSGAAGLYLKLLDEDPSQVLARQDQLDVANQLMAAGRWAPSASAYEKFLAHYGSPEQADQVHLMLGLLYGRYLSEPKQAVSHLNTALENLSDPGQIKLCKEEIARLKN